MKSLTNKWYEEVRQGPSGSEDDEDEIEHLWTLSVLVKVKISCERAGVSHMKAVVDETQSDHARISSSHHAFKACRRG